MDGTLVDSTVCVAAIWRSWATQHAVDLDRLLRVSHGRRAADTIRDVAPHLDALAEAELLESIEISARDGIVPVQGALPLLQSLTAGQWAVVTSAGRRLASARIVAAGLPIPQTLISGEDVSQGKPDPEGYIMAADELGIPYSKCLVVEDSPAGILAARRAGMNVLALSTTYAPEYLLGAPFAPDFRTVTFTLT